MSLPTVKIIVGNSLDRLRQLPDESVNCVVTSPPYWGLRDYNVEGQIGLEETFEAFLDRLAAVFAEVRLVLRADGTAWVNMGDSYASDAYGGSVGGACTLEGSRANLAASRRARTKARIPTNCKPKDLIGQPWELALRLRRDGWYWRKAIVWHKPSPMPESVKDRPTSSWEPVLLFSKSERYSYDADAIKEPCVAPQSNKPDDWERAVNRRRMTTATLRQGTYTVGNQDDRATKNRTPRPGIDDRGGGQGSGTISYPTDYRNARDVWTIPSKPFNEAHFATFPPALVEPCILAGCPIGGVVLDPFFGAGTTGLVAVQHGRSCVGIELNQNYAEIADRRIRNEAGLLCTMEVEGAGRATA